MDDDEDDYNDPQDLEDLEHSDGGGSDEQWGTSAADTSSPNTADCPRGRGASQQARRAAFGRHGGHSGAGEMRAGAWHKTSGASPAQNLQAVLNLWAQDGDKLF